MKQFDSAIGLMVLEEVLFHQDLTSGTISRLFMTYESRRRWKFLMDLEMVSDGREHPSEVSEKVSSRSDIKNNDKTPPVLQFSRGGGHS